MSIDNKHTGTKSISSKSRCNDASQSGKSIIEEWKNPSKGSKDILRSDELYEERAIDVGLDHCDHFSKQSNDVSNSKMITDIKKNEGIVRKKTQKGGTVRSIPIKNYRASIVHNIGTLRKSEAPQLQFESSVSEPEKNSYPSKVISTNKAALPLQKENDPTTTVPRITYISKASEVIKPFRKSCHSCKQRDTQPGLYYNNPKLKTIDRRIMKSDQNMSTQDNTEEFSDFDDYFRKSTSQRLNPNYQGSINMKQWNDDNEEMIDHTGTNHSKENDVAASKKLGAIDLERGHVGQKISAYEENARRSGRDWDFKCQLASEVRKHRTIGVPLVGMHNACGLPVVASWHEHELVEPLRIRTRVVGTLRPIFKGPSVSSDTCRRTHPKRKAPQPQQRVVRKNRSINLKHTEKKGRRATIRSLIPLELVDGEIVRTKRRRPSFKTTKAESSSARHSIKRTTKSDTQTNKENFLTDSFKGRPVDVGSTKRRTLYARDDGEDSVQVLKNLCLNPLARSKSGTDIMW